MHTLHSDHQLMINGQDMSGRREIVEATDSACCTSYLHQLIDIHLMHSSLLLWNMKVHQVFTEVVTLF
jgi:hypothetical protein